MERVVQALRFIVTQRETVSTLVDDPSHTMASTLLLKLSDIPNEHSDLKNAEQRSVKRTRQGCMAIVRKIGGQTRNILERRQCLAQFLRQASDFSLHHLGALGQEDVKEGELPVPCMSLKTGKHALEIVTWELISAEDDVRLEVLDERARHCREGRRRTHGLLVVRDSEVGHVQTM